MNQCSDAVSDQAELGYDDFVVQADRVGLPPELRADLYPMVRDLRALAEQINAFTPELHDEIPVAALRSGTGG